MSIEWDVSRGGDHGAVRGAVAPGCGALGVAEWRWGVHFEVWGYGLGGLVRLELVEGWGICWGWLGGWFCGELWSEGWR